VSHLWFVPLSLGLVWFLFWLLVAGLIWVFASPTLGRCAVAVVLYLSIPWHYWWIVVAIFWLAIVIGVVGALWFHSWNDSRLPHVHNDQKPSSRDANVKGVAKLASMVALAIPLFVLLLLFIRYIFGGWHWSWFGLLVLIAVVAFIALIVLLVLRGPAFLVAVLLLIAVVATMAALGFRMFGGSSSSSHGDGSGTGTPSSSPSASGSLTDDQRKAQAAAQASLIVDYGNVANVKMCNSLVTKYFGAPKMVNYTLNGKSGGQTPKFDVGAVHSMIGSAQRYEGETQRLWSMAVNVPLKPQNLEAEQATICRDPAQAAMVLNRMGPGKIGGITILSQNLWMKGLQGDPRTVVKNWAMKCMTQNVSTHIQCAQTMAATAALLGRFHSAGVAVRPTVWNVYLNGGGVAVKQVPTFALNTKQYTGYFLILGSRRPTVVTSGSPVSPAFLRNPRRSRSRRPRRRTRRSLHVCRSARRRVGLPAGRTVQRLHVRPAEHTARRLHVRPAEHTARRRSARA
jgi:hypothetical protein